MALPRARSHSITSAATTANDQRGPRGRRAEQQAGADAGDRDVADAVAHQRQALLHEEHADERRGRAHHDAGEQRELHVGAVERPRQRPRHPGQTSPRLAHVCSSSSQSGRSSWCTPRLTPVAASSAGVPSNTHAALQHDHVVEVVGDRAELVRDEQHRRVVLAATRCTSESRNSACDSTSTPAIGSSSTSSSGSAASALAMSARCCWPPESSCEPLAAVIGERDRLERVVDRLAVGGAARAATIPASPVGRSATTSSTVAGRSGAMREPLRHVPHPPAVAEVAGRDAEQLDRAASAARAARAGSAAASTSPSRWVRRARRTRPARTARLTSVEHRLGAVGERHVRRRRARRRTGVRSRSAS